MRFFSAREAAKRFGALIEAADDNPVIVRKNGRPRAAVIGWRLFERYKEAYEAAFEERQLRLLEMSICALSDGKLGTGTRARALAARLGLAGVSEKDRQQADKLTRPTEGPAG